MISLIWAMDKNRLIGKDNKLPWRLPADLAYFKKMTLGHTVIMGRKTFESIGKPLPERQNIVVSRNNDFNPKGCTVCHSILEVPELCSDGEAFVIGGADIYSAFLPYAAKLYLTLIEHEFSGDLFFPEINYDEWELVSKVKGEKNEKNPVDYYFMEYKKVLTRG
jgi:dihydrofolate reductase